MAKVKIQGHASGTGVLTVTAPNTSTDRTITLPDSTGTLATTADTGVAGITSAADATAITITSDEKVGIGETAPLGFLHVKNGDSGQGSINAAGNSLVLESNGGAGITFLTGSSSNGSIIWGDSESNYQGVILYDNSASAMKFMTSGSERVRVTDNGLTFNGDTAAANALDDYEHGTWTPVFKDSSNATITGSLYSATYTKVGQIVCAQVYFNVGDLQNGNLTSMTLPFSGRGDDGNVRQPGSVVTYGCPISNKQNTTHIADNSSVANFWQLRDNATALFYMTVDNGSELMFSWTYQTD